MKRFFASMISLLLILSGSACMRLKPAQQTPAAPAKTALPAASPASADTPAATSTAFSSDEAAIAKFTEQLKSEPSVDFTLQDLNGKQWKLSDLKGKIVLLNFWATWCGPCQSEMPGFQRLYSKFGDHGDVAVLSVSSEALEQQGAAASLDTVSQFVKKQGFTFPILFDADGKVWGKYQQEGIPANYILDSKGNVRLLVEGAFQDDKTLYAALEAVRRADSGQ